MRYIDMQEVELELPANRQAQVTAAWIYVNEKMDQKEAEIRAKGVIENWTVAKVTAKVAAARIKARKAAITAKNSM